MLNRHLKLDLARAVLIDEGLVVGFQGLNVGHFFFLRVQIEFAAEEKRGLDQLL